MRALAFTALGDGIVPRVVDGERRVFAMRDSANHEYEDVVVAIADKTRKPLDVVDNAVFMTRRDVFAKTGALVSDDELLRVYPWAIAGGDARMELAVEREAVFLKHDNG